MAPSLALRRLRGPATQTMFGLDMERRPADHPAAVFHDTQCAADYDADRFGGAFGRYLEEQEVRLFEELVGAEARSILDAGAGTGKLSIRFLRDGRDVVSADFSQAMARVAREKVSSEGLPARFAITDVQRLCFRAGSFDSTVCSRVLMHVDDWRSGVAELCRVTRNTVVLDFPPRFSAAGVDALRKRLFRGRFGAYRQPYRTLAVGAVIKELAVHGFRVVDRRGTFVLPLAWHRKLDRPELSRRIEGVLAMLGLSRWLGAPATFKAVRSGTTRGEG